MILTKWYLAAKRFLSQNSIWLIVWALTLLIVGLGAFFYWSEGIDKAATKAEFIAGFSAALAFLWLVAGLRLQSREIAMQREELQLQRIALQHQVKEMRTTAKFASLSQVENILERTKQQIEASGLEIKNANDVHQVLMRGLPKWKVILESDDANAVFKSYTEWAKIEGLVRSYIANIAAALKIYMEHYLETPIDHSKSDAEFVIDHQAIILKAIYLSEHSGNAFMLATWLHNYSRGCEAVQVAGLYASKIMIGAELFNEGALENMRAELVRKGIPMPRIAQK